MRMLYWGLAAGLLAGGCGWFRSPLETEGSRQRAVAKQYEAADLVREDKAEWTRFSTLKVRFHVTPGYRTLRPDTDRELSELVRRANEVLRATFKAELRIDAIQDWEPTTHRDDMDGRLQELEGHDRGEDVHFVVGLLPADSVVHLSYHDAGRARIGGRHSVVRAMDSTLELQQIQTFDKLDARERSDLYADRLAHKETVVFLHELGHNLGAEHVKQQHLIMHASYHQDAVGFSQPSADVMAVGLGKRLRGEVAAPPVQPARQPIAEPSRSAAPQDAHAQDGAAELADADRALLHKAQGQSDAGDTTGAWQTLQPALKRNPDSYRLHHLGCSLAMNMTMDMAERRRVCGRMTELATQLP